MKKTKKFNSRETQSINLGKNSLCFDISYGIRQLHESVSRNLIGDKKKVFKQILSQLSPALLSSEKRGEVDFCEARGDCEEKDGEDINSEILLDHCVSASLVRSELFKSNEMPEFNAYENTLHQLYKVGD